MAQAAPFALSTAWPGSLSDLQTRLARSHAMARDLNPRIRGAMSAPPTVTIAAASAAAPLNYAKPPAVAAASDYLPYVQLAGGWPIRSGSSIRGRNATMVIGAATGSDANAWCGSVRYRFHTDAPTVAWRQWGGDLLFRILVDGQYVNLAGHRLADTTGANNLVTLDFSSVGGRAQRLIEVECGFGQPTSAAQNTLHAFGPVYVSALDSVWAPQPGLRLIVAGDSYTQGHIVDASGVIGTAGDGFARVMGDFLGPAVEVWCSGVNGTGWAAQASTVDKPTLAQRLTDVTGWSPAMVMIPMGVNDVTLGFTAAQVQAAAIATLTALRAALPGVPVVVFGPWMRPGHAVATTQAMEAAIRAAVQARRTAGDLRLAFVPTIGAQGAPYQFGTGSVAAPTGNGNADLYMSRDLTHPVPAGMTHLGRRAASDFVAAILAMA